MTNKMISLVTVFFFVLVRVPFQSFTQERDPGESVTATWSVTPQEYSLFDPDDRPRERGPRGMTYESVVFWSGIAVLGTAIVLTVNDPRDSLFQFNNPIVLTAIPLGVSLLATYHFLQRSRANPDAGQYTVKDK
jgi:hypothetical protein